MEVTYDRRGDIMYIRLTDKPVGKSKIVTPNLNIDLDEDGGLIGLEIITVQGAGIDPMNIRIAHTPEDAVAQRPDQEEIRKRRQERTERASRKRAEQEKQEHPERA
jgi:uncharacterized protein YuzE